MRFHIANIEARELNNILTEELNDIPDYIWWAKFTPAYRILGDFYQVDTACVLDELLDVIAVEGKLSGDVAFGSERSGNEYDLKHHRPTNRRSSIFDDHYNDMCKELDKQQLEEV